MTCTDGAGRLHVWLLRGGKEGIECGLYCAYSACALFCVRLICKSRALLWQLQVRKVIIFLVRFCLTLYATLIIFNVGMGYEQNSALMDLLLDEEFKGANFKKNFWDIMTYEEFWEYVVGLDRSGSTNASSH